MKYMKLVQLTINLIIISLLLMYLKEFKETQEICGKCKEELGCAGGELVKARALNQSLLLAEHGLAGENTFINEKNPISGKVR